MIRSMLPSTRLPGWHCLETARIVRSSEVSGPRLPLAIVAALMMLAASCSGSSTEKTSDQLEVTPFLPTTASVVSADMAVPATDGTAISPSGQAIATPKGDEWCLQVADTVTCLAAAAQDSAAHGVVWRDDERAIAVTWGRQNPISIIDFEAGTVVETSLSTHRLLAFDDDGSLIGLDIDESQDLLRIDPTTLEATTFADFTLDGVPQLTHVSNDLVWGSVPFGPQVVVFGENTQPTVIPGGLGEQLLLSVSDGGRFALTSDEEVQRGRSGPEDTMLRLFDRDTERSLGIALADGVEQKDVVDAQLADNGAAILVLLQADGGFDLHFAPIDRDELTAGDWTSLTTWGADDTAKPRVYSANGVLRWNGGATAWILDDATGLFEVSLG